jgi:hypothetical protein
MANNFFVKVFQSDGTFVGKFGSCGSGEGQLVSKHHVTKTDMFTLIAFTLSHSRRNILTTSQFPTPIASLCQTQIIIVFRYESDVIEKREKQFSFA